MDSRDFVLWLKGYLDASPEVENLETIRTRLNEVKDVSHRVQERIVNVTPNPYVHKPKYDPKTPYKNPETPVGHA